MGGAKSVWMWETLELTFTLSLLLFPHTDVSPPGPIDNMPLLQVSGSKDNLVLVENSFRKLSTAVWMYLYKSYGGGPVVVTGLDGVRSPEE